MLKLLQAHIQQLPISDVNVTHSARDRTSYAMAMSLFAVCASAQVPVILASLTIDKVTDLHIREETKSPPPFRPHTLSTLLRLIGLVMYPHETAISDFASPLEKLDAAQTILVRWGETVPFCWTVWDDQRIAHTEYIVHLVYICFDSRHKRVANDRADSDLALSFGCSALVRW